MNWKLKEGTILTTVCGQSFLVGSDSTGSGKISVININNSAAFICQKLENGCSLDEIKRELPIEFVIPEDTDLDVMMNRFLKDLEDQGYIVSAD